MIEPFLVILILCVSSFFFDDNFRFSSFNIIRLFLQTFYKREKLLEKMQYYCLVRAPNRSYKYQRRKIQEVLLIKNFFFTII